MTTRQALPLRLVTGATPDKVRSAARSLRPSGPAASVSKMASVLLPTPGKEAGMAASGVSGGENPRLDGARLQVELLTLRYGSGSCVMLCGERSVDGVIAGIVALLRGGCRRAR